MKKNLKIQKNSLPILKINKVIDYRKYHLTLWEWMIYGGEGLILGAVFAFTFFRSIIVFLFLCSLVILFPLYSKKRLMDQRLRKLNIEFKEGIQSVASSLSAGYSVENAFKEASKVMEMLYGGNSNINLEFQYMVKQLEMNRTIEEILRDFGNRSSLEDVQNFVESFVIAKRSGGDLVAMVNGTVSKIGDKIRIDEEIHVIMAAKNLENKIMNVVPVGILLYLNITSSEFLDVLYETLMGRIVMICCLVIYVFTYWWSGKILEIHI